MLLMDIYKPTSKICKKKNKDIYLGKPTKAHRIKERKKTFNFLLTHSVKW
jgi:hypothetical protein